MRRNLLACALALCAVVAAGCGSGSKGSGGSSAYSGDAATYNVAVVKPTGGFVTQATVGINCGHTETVDQNACDGIGINRTTTPALTFAAAAAEGYTFRQWAGDCSGTASTCSINNASQPAGSTATIFRIVAVFDPKDGRVPDATPVNGRVYGYVFGVPVAAASATKATANNGTVTLTFAANPNLVVNQVINVVYAAGDATNFKSGPFAVKTITTPAASPWTVTYDDGVKLTPAPGAPSAPPTFAVGLSGITVSLQQSGAEVASLATMAKGLGSVSGGRYAIDVPAGTYQVVVKDSASPAAYTFAAQSDVVVADPSTSCTVEPQMVLEGGEGVKGCLVRKDVVNSATATGFAGPGITVAATINGGASPQYQIGLGVPVTLACSASGGTFGSALATSWSQTAGPSYEDTSGWTATQVFNVPGLDKFVALTAQADSTQTVSYPYAGQPWGATTAAKVVSCPKYDGEFEGTQGSGNQVTKVGCSAANLYFPDNQLSFLTVGRQMMNEMAYTFSCVGTRTASGTDFVAINKPASSSIVTVQLAAAHGIRTGEKVTIKIGTGERNFAAGTFTATVTAADTFTYDDKKVNTAAAGPLAGFTASVAASKSAQFYPLNLVNAALPNDDKVVGVASPATLDTFASVPLNSLVVANGGLATSAGGYAWTFTPATGSTATLQGSGRFVWFKANAADNGGFSLSLTTNFGDATKTAAVKTIGAIGSTWVGFTGAGPFGSCQGCHTGAGSGPKPEAAAWATSRHNQIINGGMSGPDYSNSCLACHTQGYDVSGLANNGWFDLAKTAGPGNAQFNMPDFMFLSDSSKNFGVKTLPASLQTLSNIACENCHGPGGSTHPDRASYSADACKVCHDGGHHNIYNQWLKAGEGHSNKPTSDGRVGRAACQPCHVAQGIVAYWEGNVKPQVKVSGDGLVFANLTTDNNSAITCQVCHEPHSLALRLGKAEAEAGIVLGTSTTYADYSLPSCNAAAVPPVVLPNCNTYTNAPSWSGIRLTGDIGNGALCVTCHNSRRSYGRLPGGAENQLPSWVSPHDSTAAEIYLNLGTYWFGATPPVYAAHRAEGGWIKDGCVDCHVKVIPAGYPTVANHTFNANHSCEVCHGSGMLPAAPGSADDSSGLPQNSKGQAIVQRTEGQIQAIADKVLAALNAYNATVPLKVASIDITGKTLAKAQIVDGALWLWLDEAQAPIKTNIDGVTRIAAGTYGGVVLTAGSKLVQYNAAGTGLNINYAKALYNVFMVQRDHSEGIHNFEGVKALLDVSLANLGALQ